MQSSLPREPAKLPFESDAPIRVENSIEFMNIHYQLLSWACSMNTASSDEKLLFKSLEYAAERLKFSSFKELQSKACKSALKGEDVFINHGIMVIMVMVNQRFFEPIQSTVHGVRSLLVHYYTSCSSSLAKFRFSQSSDRAGRKLMAKNRNFSLDWTKPERSDRMK